MINASNATLQAAYAAIEAGDYYAPVGLSHALVAAIGDRTPDASYAFVVESDDEFAWTVLALVGDALVTLTGGGRPSSWAMTEAVTNLKVSIARVPEVSVEVLNVAQPDRQYGNQQIYAEYRVHLGEEAYTMPVKAHRLEDRTRAETFVRALTDRIIDRPMAEAAPV